MASETRDRLLEKKRELERQLREIREEFRKTGGGFLVDHYRELFAKYPEVKGYRWTQYTPYFNDGDACTFRSHHEDGGILLIDPDADPGDEPELENFEHECSWVEYDTPEWRRLDEINGEFRGHFPDLDDDDMEALFGDHIEVTIYPDRIEAEEYDHD